MAEGRDNCVYVAEVDTEAVAKAIRRRWFLVLLPIPLVLAGVGLAAVLARLEGHPPSLADILQRLLVGVVVLGVVACFLMAVPFRIRETTVMIGADFLVAPLAASPNYVATVKFESITRVRISLSRGQITGAAVTAKTARICTGWIKNPGIVVRAIFERAPETVKWRRAWRPLKRLSREHVRELIEEANVPDIYSLRPSPTDYTQADDLTSSEECLPGLRGWLERFFGRGTCKTMTIMSPQVPTPASRYVNAMLIQMFKRGPKTRVLGCSAVPACPDPRSGDSRDPAAGRRARQTQVHVPTRSRNLSHAHRGRNPHHLQRRGLFCGRAVPGLVSIRRQVRRLLSNPAGTHPEVTMTQRQPTLQSILWVP